MHPPADRFSWWGSPAGKKNLLTVRRKNCLPYKEKSAYRSEKILLTKRRKNPLPPAVKSAYRAQPIRGKIRNHFDVCFVRTYGLRLLDMFCHRNSTGTIRTSGIVMVIINSHVIHPPFASSFL
jgi:hypothetical protein